MGKKETTLTDKTQLHRYGRRWLIAGGIIVLLAVVAYFGAGYMIYDTLTVVHPRCESKYMDGRRDFTPSYFEGIYDYPEIDIDVTPYLMSNFETVAFPAHEDGVNISAWLVKSETPRAPVSPG